MHLLGNTTTVTVRCVTSIASDTWLTEHLEGFGPQGQFHGNNCRQQKRVTWWLITDQIPAAFGPPPGQNQGYCDRKTPLHLVNSAITDLVFSGFQSLARPWLRQ
jgi:hypothetical protein